MVARKGSSQGHNQAVVLAVQVAVEVVEEAVAQVDLAVVLVVVEAQVVVALAVAQEAAAVHVCHDQIVFYAEIVPVVVITITTVRNVARAFLCRVAQKTVVNAPFHAEEWIVH